MWVCSHSPFKYMSIFLCPAAVTYCLYTPDSTRVSQTLTRSCGLKVFTFVKIDLMKIRKLLFFTHKLIKNAQFTNWNSSEWAQNLHDFDNTGVKILSEDNMKLQPPEVYLQISKLTFKYIFAETFMLLSTIINDFLCF